MNTSSLLNDSLNIQTESDDGNRSSIETIDSSAYNQKCRRFESALRKIELDNFVIYDKVDEFLLMKKSKSDNENKEINCFNNMIEEEHITSLNDKYNHLNCNTVIEKPAQRCSLT